ncbi:HAD family hydrolase [Streptomyces sp. NPDC056240]|uniref:HAD family hydrolase n=1 Tax=Streptomyces sp. NPDC056240 TaxID=3345759 RepID=UPI0035D936DA
MTDTSNEPEQPAAVLFDVDGTLMDTVYLHTVAWWEALRQAGHRIGMTRIHRCIGMGSDHLLETLLGKDPDPTGDDRICASHDALYGQPGAGMLQRPAGRRTARARAGRAPRRGSFTASPPS